MKRILALLLAVMICCSLCACGTETQTVEMKYGEEHTIELKKQQDDLVWESSDEDVVTVKNGVVTGVGPGEAVVLAQKGDKTVAQIDVSVSLIDVSALLFSQKTEELEVEETLQLQYVKVPENASDYGLIWKSTNSEIVEVDGNGSVRAVAPGTSTIVISAPNGVLDTCEITVNAPSAIEQLNEYEKRLFDVMIETFLPNFYNAPAVRIHKIETFGATENLGDPMILLVNIQGTNKLGGTLIKDYMITCNSNISESMYLPCVTESGLFDRSTGVAMTEVTSMDYTKINAALEEYWDESVHN